MCENILKAELPDGSPYHPNCPTYYDGFAKGNFNSFNKGKLRIFDSFIQEWEMKKNDPEEVIGMLYKRNFRNFMAYFQVSLSSCYYEILTDLLDTMMDQLEKNYQISNSYIIIAFSVAIFLSVISFGVIVAPIQKAMIYFGSVFLIFPIGLMEKNVIIKHRLVKFKKGDPIYNL